MTSSSLKDVTKAISASITALPPHLPLPSSLTEILHDYVAKHSTPDEDPSQRLHDELQTIYTTQVVKNPSRLAPFLSVLGILKPTIAGSGRLLQWWQTLSGDVLNNLGSQKGLAHEAREIILDLLVVEDEDSKESEILQDQKVTAHAIGDNLIKIWMHNNKSALENLDQHAQFLEKQLQHILLAFGRKKPKEFLISVNKFFVKKETRILALTLLCEFIRHQPPHLHQMMQTPLFENLLKCLQYDTSTRVISLAMTTLVMFLPHIPSSLGPHLPALFNIYSRMLFWDRERSADDKSVNTDDEDDEDEKRSTPATSEAWVKMSFLLESDDETVPELLHYFTFLYGLYPINFMSYIRKPQKYLRSSNFPGADELDIDPTEIRQRSESFRLVHLLHPNFFHLTMESELTDTNRWINSEAADVVAECMGMFTAGDDHDKQESRTRGPTQKLNLDIPGHALLGDSQTLSAKQAGWRDTRHSNISQDESLHRTFSQTSQGLSPGGDSPTLPPMGSDSPTIPPQMLSSSNNQLSSMLSSQRSARGSVADGSVRSLALSNTLIEPSIDFLSPLERDSIPRKISEPIDSAVKIAYLHREIQLLRNDVNLEQYLKAQHLSHIGHLRRKQLREARAEAETQNLINANRQLKSKYEEAKKINIRMRTETEKSKLHSRKWETTLSDRVRAMREDQKNVTFERNQLKRDLEAANENLRVMRQVVVMAENAELGARTEGIVYKAAEKELQDLRTENARLLIAVRDHELNENLAVKAIETEESTKEQMDVLKMMLNARETELHLAHQAYAIKLRTARSTSQNGDGEDAPNLPKRHSSAIGQDMFDNALASSRNRAMEISKAYARLQRKYSALHDENMDLKEELDSRMISSGSPPSPSPPTRQQQYSDGYASPGTSPTVTRSMSTRSIPISETGTWDNDSIIASSNIIPSRSRTERFERMETIPGLESGSSSIAPPRISPAERAERAEHEYNTDSAPTSPVSSLSPSGGGHGHGMHGVGASHFMGTEPFLGSMRPGSKGKEKEVHRQSLRMDGRYDSPRPTPRVYGRGGVQNASAASFKDRTKR